MMSTNFYPAVPSGETRYRADELGNREDRPQQLSFLDRLLNRADSEPQKPRG
jgi:hypothetical protein